MLALLYYLLKKGRDRSFKNNLSQWFTKLDRWSTRLERKSQEITSQVYRFEIKIIDKKKYIKTLNEFYYRQVNVLATDQGSAFSYFL